MKNQNENNQNNENVDCKSFGKKNANFKKCTSCKAEVKEECKELFSALVLKKSKEVEEEVEEVKEVESTVEKKKVEETVVKVGKIGKAQQIKDKIFSLAKKAMYTRRELGKVMRESFPEYQNSTISTYISDSFNVKYAQATGCGKHRMLAYVQVGSKKVSAFLEIGRQVLGFKSLYKTVSSVKKKLMVLYNDLKEGKHKKKET